MIHLKGGDRGQRLAIAKKEIALYREAGLDGVVVENYFGDKYDVESVLGHIRSGEFGMLLGVNVLGDDKFAFEAARKHGADFMQIDSVAGHLAPEDDLKYHEFIMENREACRPTKILGGVRFKYQPYKSGRTLEEDMRIGMSRCDAIVVTQDATGQETSMEKITEFRGLLGSFPLFAGAGMTPENCAKQLELVDGAIVGSYFKDSRKADGDVCLGHCTAFMDAVNEVRRREDVA
jgi:predicted TIM-barrel enzyme